MARPFDQEIDCGPIYDADPPRPPRELPAVVGPGRGVPLGDVWQEHHDPSWRFELTASLDDFDDMLYGGEPMYVTSLADFERQINHRSYEDHGRR